MSTTAISIINTAKRFLGCNESNGTHKVIIDEYNKIFPLPRHYKVSYNDSWCAAYISVVASICDALDIIPTECSCGNMLSLCKKKGIFIESDSIIPEIGDIIFFDWNDYSSNDCTGWPDHVGYILEFNQNSKTFSTIEGNKNHAVGIRTMPLNSRFIRGFARPKYSTSFDEFNNPNNLDSICKFVIRGDFGNGQERVSRLTSLGYDARAVQDRVNELLGFKK